MWHERVDHTLTPKRRATRCPSATAATEIAQKRVTSLAERHELRDGGGEEDRAYDQSRDDAVALVPDKAAGRTRIRRWVGRPLMSRGIRPRLAWQLSGSATSASFVTPVRATGGHSSVRCLIERPIQFSGTRHPAAA